MTKTINEIADSLSPTEQIDLICTIAQRLNQHSKQLYLCFLPVEESSDTNDVADGMFTNEEFEILLDWLEKLRHNEKITDLKLSINKRVRLIDLIAQSFMDGVPGWKDEKDFWPEDDIEIFETYLEQIRS